MMKYLWIITLAFFSCNNPVSTEEKSEQSETSAKPATDLLEHTSWLLGEWHHVGKDGHSMEMWQRESDTTFTGSAYFVAGKDTVSSESLRMVQRGNELVYIAKVKGQNDNKPVEFRLTDTTKQKLLFENPAHDFPQKITYVKVSKIYMVVRISGKIDGKNEIREFPMIRK